MFKTQQEFTNSMFGSYAYKSIIKRNQDHLLVKMNKLINWSFIEEEVLDYYSEKGQKAFHPEKIFKILIIQNLYNMSERDVCVNVDCNIIYRYFVGLSITEEVPHWTDLGKFKERIGVEVFEKLFYRVLEEAKRLGIEISNKRNADATDLKANVDISKCAKDKQDKDDHGWVDRNTTDPEADFGRKGKGKSWYGYKSHTNQDTENELVTAVVTTSAKETDGSQLIPLIDKELDFRDKRAIRQQGGDKSFVGHSQELEDRQILDYIIPRDDMTRERERKKKNNHYLHLRKQRPRVERKFAEGKKHHGLGKARHRGRWKIHLRSLLIYLTMNLKRIVNVLVSKFT